MNSTRVKIAGGLLALTVAFGAGIYAGVSHLGDSAQAQVQTTTIVLNPDTQPAGVNMAQFWKAWNLLDAQYVPTHASSTTPSYQERLYGAIGGLTASFGDPYTVFLPPSDAKVFQEDISGSFSGVGMELALRGTNITVVAPLKNSPAEAAGVRSGDVLLSIDGKSTDSMTVEAAVKLIRGTKGTTVKLSINRAGEAAPLSISVVRDTIQIPVINNYKRSDGIYVVELYSFSQNSADLFRNALRDFFQSGSTKLMLDLRGNPGGYLDAAVEMASYFLPVGDVVVVEDFKGKQANISHRSYGYNVFANKKLSMAMLVDQGSASASEILAGALQQHGVAKLIGTRTFGKGSVQELMELGNGAELKITIARWLTPNGTSISDGGLTPDFKADRTDADIKASRDPQKDAAVEWLTQQ